jgi:hypothetical protein
MKCSSCGDLLFPVVAIDIDGTLADYHGHFLRFAEAYLNIKIPMTYDGSIGFKEWFRQMTGVDERTWADIKLAYRQGAQKRSQPVREGAFDLVTALTGAGAEIWVTTTRPYLRLDGIDPDTRFWLNEQAILYYGLLYHEDKYRELDKRVERGRVVAVLDDLPEQYDAAEEIWGSDIPILARNRWNLGVDRDNVALTLTDAAIVIAGRVTNWYANAGVDLAGA